MHFKKPPEFINIKRKKRKKKKKDFRKELGDVLKANPEDFDEKGDDANDDCK